MKNRRKRLFGIVVVILGFFFLCAAIGGGAYLGYSTGVFENYGSSGRSVRDFDPDANNNHQVAQNEDDQTNQRSQQPPSSHLAKLSDRSGMAETYKKENQGKDQIA